MFGSETPPPPEKKEIPHNLKKKIVSYINVLFCVLPFEAKTLEAVGGEPSIKNKVYLRIVVFIWPKVNQTHFIYWEKVRVVPWILRDKTMEDILIYIPNESKQNKPSVE